MTASPTDTSLPRDRTRTIYCWACVAAYAALLTVASLLPSGGEYITGGWDSVLSPTAQNVLHLPAYALLTGLLLVAADRSWQIKWIEASLLVATCLAYGAILELLQAVAIPGRVGDWSDVLWNTTGGAGGCLCWLLFRHILTPPV